MKIVSFILDTIGITFKIYSSSKTIFKKLMGSVNLFQDDSPWCLLLLGRFHKICRADF